MPDILVKEKNACCERRIQIYKRVINVVILGSGEERVKLLKSGFTGKEIEKLYVILNSFDVVEVNWQELHNP